MLEKKPWPESKNWGRLLTSALHTTGAPEIWINIQDQDSAGR